MDNREPLQVYFPGEDKDVEKLLTSETKHEEVTALDIKAASTG